MSSREDFALWPFAEVGDEVYDLDSWNPEYWTRFERFLDATQERDIIVQIEVWAQFDFYLNDSVDEASWRSNPFNPANNRNYRSDDAELLRHPPSNSPAYADNAFFWSVPELGDFTEILEYQQRYVDKILSYTLDYPHVLYCIDNETHTDPRWGTYWADYLRQRAHRQGRTVELTQMYWMPNVRHPKQSFVSDHPETYTYWDISQSIGDARTAYRLLDPPRPLTSVKVYGSDDDDSPEWAVGAEEVIDRFWQAIFSGVAATRFHRPPTGLGLSDRAAHHIEAARDVTGEFDLFACEPDLNRISDTTLDTVYPLVNPGSEYAVYFPAGGNITIEVNGVDSCRWYDISRKTVTETDSIEGSTAELRTPGDDRWVALLE